MITYVKGDATAVSPHASTSIIIPHVTNDMGAWGAGFVMALSRKWPEPEAEYHKAAKDGTLKQGLVQLVEVAPRLHVANMCAQTLGVPYPLSYSALDKCLEKVALAARMSGAQIVAPKFGTGLARGDWSRIVGLIEKHFQGVPFFVFEL